MLYTKSQFEAGDRPDDLRPASIEMKLTNAKVGTTRAQTRTNWPIGRAGPSRAARPLFVLGFVAILVAGFAFTSFPLASGNAPSGGSSLRLASGPPGLGCVTVGTPGTLSVVSPASDSGIVGSSVRLQGSGFDTVGSVFIYFYPPAGTPDKEVGFVPALSGLGTPWWDFGARGGIFGLTRGTTRAHLVRAVLEGLAQRGADLVEAAGAELGRPLDEVRVDGGVSASRFVVRQLADLTGCAVAVSAEREATTRGAGLMALVSAGHLSLADVEATWAPSQVVEPSIGDDEREARRTRWRDLVARVRRTIPELSDVAF